MTTQTANRQHLHDYINAMPEYSLPLVEPILAHFADEPLAVETNLTADEKADIAEGRRLRKEHPEEFISLDHYLEHGVS